MRFVPGQQLGPYTIHSFLGKGAMGEVYRAQDTRVQRAVAIKVLHPHMAERQAIRKRFEREARVLSALSHPNICAFQELATANGSDYLVMELLDGETLARLLGRGPLPLPQALHFAHQLASALDASHRIGLTHRDLKPGNLIVTRTGIKVLDFGLAKEDGPLPSTGGPSADEDSTVVEPLTESGAILGTFQYMAPEQLEGKAVDVRADIFSFGCILHEMLTGQRAFSGQSKAGLIASVLTQTPAPPSSVRADLPPALDRLVEGCLAKDPGDRWQSMRDVQRILDWAATPQQPSTAPATAAKRWLAPAALATALIAIGLLGWTLFVQRGQAPNPTVRLEIPPPPGLQYFPFPQVGPPIISPNGKLIVLPMTDGNRVFFTLRALNSSEMKVLDGTEGGTFPFWSPDSRHIAFFQKGRLVRMPIAGPQRDHSLWRLGRRSFFGPGRRRAHQSRNQGVASRSPLRTAFPSRWKQVPLHRLQRRPSQHGNLSVLTRRPWEANKTTARFLHASLCGAQR
jgi:tRNA A-37 threonylcarbamoyl transferase component Bud32